MSSLATTGVGLEPAWAQFVGRRRSWRAAMVLVSASDAVALAWFGWSHPWVTEDAFIDFRVAQHLLAGHGPVFSSSSDWGQLTGGST